MFKYFLVFFLLEVFLCFLQVYGPTCIVSRLPNNIECTLSNFGQVPYGQTILGQIRLPNEAQLCSTQGQLKSKKGQSNTKDVFLVKRGKCKFTQKVINAQNLGADVIIIYDNLEGSSPVIIMKNDGHGHLAEIPSLFISNDDGLKLLATSKECFELPLVKIQFEIDQKQKSQVTLWIDAGNRQTYILARDFYKNDYYEAIKDRIDFNVRFRIENTCDNWVCGKDDCIYSNLLQRYCRNAVKSDNPAVNYPKGVDLIQEELRQYYLWQQLKQTNYKVKWWRYMTIFDHEVCIQATDIAECSYNAMKDAKISDKVIKKVKADVQSLLSNIEEKQDNILLKSYNQSKELGIYFYPQATINNRNFYGLFKAPEVFETICNSLIDPPIQCVKFVKQNHNINVQKQETSNWNTIIIIFSLMSLGFLVALIIYTNILKKQINQQLSVQVNKMVQSYVSTANKRNGVNGYSKFES